MASKRNSKKVFLYAGKTFLARNIGIITGKKISRVEILIDI
jgi:hypothetical protein